MDELKRLLVKGLGVIYLLVVCNWKTEKNWFEVSWSKNREKFRTLKKAYARFLEVEKELYGRDKE